MGGFGGGDDDGVSGTAGGRHVEGGWDAPLVKAAKKNTNGVESTSTDVETPTSGPDISSNDNETPNKSALPADGVDATDPLAEYSPPDEYEEACYFIRDMRGCMREWWVGLMEVPGMGW